MSLAKSQRSLKAWGKQKWRTKSGKKSSETGERYLPEKAIKALSAKEYAATTRAKRKAKKKDDRCTRIAKRKYDAWPSAYASGAVVQCRRGKIWKGIKEDFTDEQLAENQEYEKGLEAKIRKALKDEGFEVVL